MSAVTAPATTLDVLDPATGERRRRIPAGSTEAADAAVRAAAAAAPAWARTAARERGAVLKAAARRLREHALEELAELQTREGGKPLADSRGGVEAGDRRDRAVRRARPRAPRPRAAGRLGRHRPHGPRAARRRRAARAVERPARHRRAARSRPRWSTGNAVVLKPSEKTPLARSAARSSCSTSPTASCSCCWATRAPGGRSPRTRASTSCAHGLGADRPRARRRLRGDRLGKALLELGGKDALIVDAGVDPVWAAGQAAIGRVRQRRPDLHVGRADLRARGRRRAVHRGARAPGPGAAPSVPGSTPRPTMGPLIDERQREIGRTATSSEAAAARRRGPDAAARSPTGPGCFYPPTVLAAPTDDCAGHARGDVRPGRRRAHRGRVLRRGARGGRPGRVYGLAATVLTPASQHAQRAWRELRGRHGEGQRRLRAARPAARPSRAGASGTGFGYGPELLDEVTRTKVVHVEPAPRA